MEEKCAAGSGLYLYSEIARVLRQPRAPATAEHHTHGLILTH